MAYLLNYTRKPINEFLYDPKLAYSMHLALSEDGKEYQALNHNSGVLFVKATENEDGSLNAKSLKNPWLFPIGKERFGVAAVRVCGEGEEDEESKGSIVLFISEDLLEYKEIGLLQLGTEYIEKIFCTYEPEKERFRFIWCEKSGNWFQAESVTLEQLQLSGEPKVCEDFLQKAVSGIEVPVSPGIEGAVCHNVIEIPARTAERLKNKLLTPVNTGIQFPEQIEAANPEQLQDYIAKALYSDGSTAYKRVDFDLSQVDFHKKGTYEITGRVRQEHFEFPVAYNRADPCIGRWNGKYYFIATNDADNNHSLYIREAETISELVEAEEHLILDSKMYPEIGGLLWAPEFHVIRDKLYIFHAATPGEFFYEESHVMELREGGNPICSEDWSRPKRVVKKDGSQICEAGKEITLDMTCFEWQGELYAVWSQRQFLPKDLGAWLYIAKLNEQEPWKLLSDPVILSKPEYGWANNHTFVDEGPFALIRGDRLFLTFSSAAVDTSYVVGLLTIEKGKDLLNVHNWKKKNYPILTARSVEGEYGTGHNAYVEDDDGNIWNTYHARPGIDGVRSSGIRRVHFDVDGEPVLDLTEEADIKEEYRTVITKLTVT